MKSLCVILLQADSTNHFSFFSANTSFSAIATLIVGSIAAGIALNNHARSTRATIEHQKASIALQCLQRYLDISEYRTKAIIEGHQERAKQYWRALIDLVWAEFHLWEKEYVDDSYMYIWCKVRRFDFEKNRSVPVGTVNIFYQEVWNELLAEDYFLPEDNFRAFLNRIHTSSEDINIILADYKDAYKQKLTNRK